MSGRAEASSRLSKRILLSIIAVSGMFAVAAFVSGNVGAQQSQQMVASWYGPGFEGASTASGAPFDPYGYTAAHKTLAFGTKLIVTYNGASVVVEITDRGPYIAGRDLDLSQGAADYIGLTAAGEGVVDVTYADASTPVGPYSGATATPVQQQTTPQDQTSVAETQSVTDTTSDVQNRDVVNGVTEDQYAETADVADSAADDQYSVIEEQYDVDVVAQSGGTPVVPTGGTLEVAPVEFVTPDSTVQRRIDLQEAAPPVEHVAPIIIDKVYEAPKKVVGITVLPDTGGLPLLPLAGVAASLLLGGGLAFGLLRR